MQTEGDAILRDIREHPEDDLPRLAYADWLEETDKDLALAEFIRLQMQVAALERDGKAAPPAIRDRERELLVGPKPALYEHAVCWFHSGSGTDTWRILFAPEFRRGFPWLITCRLGDLMSNARELFSRYPIEDVRLTDRRPVPVGDGWAACWTVVEDFRSVRLPNALPRWLFKRLAAEKVTERIFSWRQQRFTHARYASDAAAILDLSRALVAHGRSLAFSEGQPHVPG